MDVNEFFNYIKHFSTPDGIVELWRCLGSGDIEKGANWDYDCTSLDDVIRAALVDMLKITKGVQKDAADRLNISPRKINYLIHSTFKIQRYEYE